MSKELSVLGEHPHVQAVDEQDHSRALVFVPHADVVKATAVTKRHLAVLVDPILTDPHTGADLDPRPRRSGLVPRLEGDQRRLSSTRPVRPHVSTQAGELALILCALGRFAEADQLANVSEETAAGEDALSQILWRRARAAVLAHQGDLDRALVLAREAVALAESTDALNVKGAAFMDLAEVLRLSGRGGEAIPVAERAVALFDQKGNVVSAERARRTLTELVARDPGQKP